MGIALVALLQTVNNLLRALFFSLTHGNLVIFSDGLFFIRLPRVSI